MDITSLLIQLSNGALGGQVLGSRFGTSNGTAGALDLGSIVGRLATASEAR